MQRILIIRFSSIGDIVLTGPVIRGLKKRFPNADIRYATKTQYVDLLRGDPHLNGVFLLNENLRVLASELRAFRPQLVIDLHHNLRTRILRVLIGGRWTAFRKLNVQKWLKVHFKVDCLPPVHVVDRYMETVRTWGVEPDGKGLELYFPSDFQEPDVPAELTEGYVAVVIGAKFGTKRLPEHKLVELCNGITRPVLLIGGPEDQAMGEAIVAQSSATVLNGCGTYSLLESAWFISKAQLVVTHDTGMMHIAAAFKRKIISIWGNTIPAFGMYPYLPEEGVSYISEVKGLDCRPCSKIGYATCPKGHFKCMEQQDVPAILRKVKEFQH